MKTSQLFIILSISTLVVLISCGSKKGFKNWSGLGIGDGYLEIKDSILTLNGPDYFIKTYRIDSILNDSIYCTYKDFDTGELKHQAQFGHSINLDKITAQIGVNNYEFYSIKDRKWVIKNKINKVVYKTYHYNGQLIKQYDLSPSGSIKMQDKVNAVTTQEMNIQKVQNVFNKLSKLDLDNFVWSEKNFLHISHAPCHCLYIEYNLESKLLYCRQTHNNYIKSIIAEFTQ